MTVASFGWTLRRWPGGSDAPVSRRTAAVVASAGPLAAGSAALAKWGVSDPVATLDGGYRLAVADAALGGCLFVALPAAGVAVAARTANGDERVRYGPAYAVAAAGSALFALAVGLAWFVRPGARPAGPDSFSSPWPPAYPHVGSFGDAVATALFLLVVPAVATLLVRVGRRRRRIPDGHPSTTFGVAVATAALTLVTAVQVVDTFGSLLPWSDPAAFSHGPVEAVVAGALVTAVAAAGSIVAARRRHRDASGVRTDGSGADGSGADDSGPAAQSTTVVAVGVTAAVTAGTLAALAVLAHPPEQTIAGYRAYWGLFEVTSVAVVTVASGGLAAVGVRALRTVRVVRSTDGGSADRTALGVGDWLTALAATAVVSVGATLAVVLLVALAGRVPGVPPVVAERLRPGAAAVAGALVLGAAVAGRLALASHSLSKPDRSRVVGPGASRAITALAAVAVVAAILGTSGLAHGLAAREQLEPSQAEFAFAYEPVNDTHGRLTVTHDGGDAVLASALSVRGDGFADVAGATQTAPGRWRGSTTSLGTVRYVAPDDNSFGPADSLTAGVRATCEIRLVSTSDDGRTRTLGTYDCPENATAAGA